MQTSFSVDAGRIVFLDYLRAIACLMVIIVHSCEFFFIGGDAIHIRTLDDGFWVSVIDSGLRASVPLFIMASSYLLLPLREDTVAFFKRRFVRVVVPFVIWSVLYAVLPLVWGGITYNEAGSNLLNLIFNFNGASGHLWFIYMLIGLYLFMPVLSPWLKQVPKRVEQGFLGLWLFTTLFPYIRLLAPMLWGECYWNEFGTFFYFSGFIGYLVLAHYIRTYINWSLRRSLWVGIPLFVVGYLFTAVVFYHQVEVATVLQELELSWRFCSFNVVMMTIGLFLIFKKINCSRGTLYTVVKDISKLSYGMYLMHIFVLGFVYELLHVYFTTPVTIVLVGVLTYMVCYGVAKLLSLLPGSKYLVG